MPKVLLLSRTRSGSTLLAELLTLVPGSTLVFEPSSSLAAGGDGGAPSSITPDDLVALFSCDQVNFFDKTFSENSCGLFRKRLKGPNG